MGKPFTVSPTLPLIFLGKGDISWQVFPVVKSKTSDFWVDELLGLPVVTGAENKNFESQEHKIGQKEITDLYLADIADFCTLFARYGFPCNLFELQMSNLLSLTGCHRHKSLSMIEMNSIAPMKVVSLKVIFDIA